MTGEPTNNSPIPRRQFLKLSAAPVGTVGVKGGKPSYEARAGTLEIREIKCVARS